MKDTIIKGSGNSRTIKSVPNAPTLYPSYDSFIQALATSGLPIDLLGLNAAGINQAGTDINKANMLPDAVEQAIWGNAADRNIGQALQQLRSLIDAAQNTADLSLSSRAPSISGRYIGTGTEISITFPFSPKLFVALGQPGNVRQIGIFCGGYIWGMSGSNTSMESTQISENTLTWSRTNIVNESGTGYYYTAIG